MSHPNGSINAVPKPFHGIWEGQNKIVIGIDVGTTQSGVTFAFLQQGADQTMHRVTRWPGQEAQNEQSKIPTLVWYNIDKRPVSFGAEALSPRAEEDAEDNSWQLAKHFKLHLHPNDMRSKYNFTFDPLPEGVSLRQIYSDFLGYLLKHTQTFFEDRIIDGKMIWETYQPQMEVVIAHPNGWGIREQTFLRAVAVNAGLVSELNAPRKVRFVTEAEASVHFCIHHTNLGSRLQPDTKFAVCDAGGSTVDTTVYSVIAARPMLKLQEARASACVQAGAIFVDAMAQTYLQSALTNASLDTEDVQECTKRGVKDFEGAAKRSFCDTSEDSSIEIAGIRFNKPATRIRRGRMALSGEIVKSFFDGCVKEIIASVDEQTEGIDVSYILLVGGFGDSPFLRQEFRKQYEPRGSQITLTNNSSSKAVADGAVIWSTLGSVVGRAPRSSFGIEVAVRLNPLSPEFQGRGVFTCASGYEKVSGGWMQIVAKDIVLDAQAITRESFSEAFSTPEPHLEDFKINLLSYSNNGEPKWTRNMQGELQSGFQKSCTITANLKNLSGALEPRIGIHGSKYWRLYFDVCIRFGGTELEAYLEWEENGTTRTGEVTIVPDEIF